MAVALLGVFGVLALLTGAGPARAATLVPISGSGSTWSSNAMDQWTRNVKQFGIKVSFAATGSSDGRNQFKNGTVDFAVSEIPYGTTDNNVTEPPPGRQFAYMPIVAGGTAFMYNLKAAGKRITNLKLSGDVLTKIFTGAISRWDDPAIKADNPGLALPARPVVPIVRSDGSGTTAQFTLWMSKKYPDLWNAYCQKLGRATPCGQTSNYPAKAPFLALNGSLGVSGYVSTDQNEGSITYVEYSYALNTHFPVVKLLNKANYYVEPTAPNVAVALTGAQINSDLTQKLDNVYDNADKRAYPLSSYSYMIVPTKLETPLTPDKGYTLSKFINYFLCQGQQAAPDLGYSPLPKNLVEAGLSVVDKIPNHDTADVDITKCQNPTFSASGENLLAKTAPQPSECDRKGATSCGGTAGTPNPGGAGGTGNTGGGATGPGSTGRGTTGTGTTGTGMGTTGTGTGTTGAGATGTGTGAGTGTTGTGTTGTGTTGTGGATAGPVAVPTDGVTPPATGDLAGGTGGAVAPGAQGTVIDPDTGQPVGTGTGAGTGAATGTDPAVAVPVALTGAAGGGLNGVLVVMAVMLLAGLVAGPPLAARRLAAQRRQP